jgi:hypothetical protein
MILTVTLTGAERGLKLLPLYLRMRDKLLFDNMLKKEFLQQYNTQSLKKYLNARKFRQEASKRLRYNSIFSRGSRLLREN